MTDLGVDPVERDPDRTGGKPGIVTGGFLRRRLEDQHPGPGLPGCQRSAQGGIRRSDDNHIMIHGARSTPVPTGWGPMAFGRA